MSLTKTKQHNSLEAKTRRRRRWISRVGVMKVVLVMGGKGSSWIHAVVSSEDILSILRQSSFYRMGSHCVTSHEASEHFDFLLNWHNKNTIYTLVLSQLKHSSSSWNSRSLNTSLEIVLPHIFIQEPINYWQNFFKDLRFSQRLLWSVIFWDITWRSPLKINRSFGGTCRLLHQGRRIS
jgi:hypothetical protein